eukprot:373185-Pelagomonas_calceolata.AAC.1
MWPWRDGFMSWRDALQSPCYLLHGFSPLCCQLLTGDVNTSKRRHGHWKTSMCLDGQSGCRRGASICWCCTRGHAHLSRLKSTFAQTDHSRML